MKEFPAGVTGGNSFWLVLCAMFYANVCKKIFQPPPIKIGSGSYRLIGLFFIILILNFLSISSAHAQANGDFRSNNASASWNNPLHWLQRTGGNWLPTANYPGQTAATITSTVYIQSGHTVTINVSPANSIAALTFEANAANSSVTGGGNFTLGITGNITFANPTADNRSQTLAVGAATVNCGGSIAMANTTNNTRLNNVTVGAGGTLTVNGNIATAGAVGENILDLTGTGILNIAGNYTGNGAFTVSNTSTVKWFGDNTNFRTMDYGNLVLELPVTATNNRTKTAGGAITVNGNFTVQSLHASNAITFNPAGNNFQVVGTTNINARGILNDGTNGGVNTFGGAVTVAANGSWTTTSVTTAGNLIFQGGVSSSGTFTAGTATFNTASQAIGGSAPMSFRDVTITGATVNVTNNNTNTVTISGTGAAQLTGTAGATFTQGAGSTLSYAGSTITNITLNASAVSNTVIYAGANPTILAASYNDLTYTGAGTATATGSSSLSGNLTTNTGAFTSATSSVMVFNGAGTQTISGTGAIGFAGITMSKTSGNVAVSRSISASETISWTTDGLLVLPSGVDLTLGTAGTFSGSNSSRYIQVDGSTGDNSQLIKQNSGVATEWKMLFPIGTSTGGYTPLDLSTATVSVNPNPGSTLVVKAIYTANAPGHLRRSFRLKVNGNTNATTFTSGVFSFASGTDVSSGDALGDYSTIWQLDVSLGSWTSVPGTIGGTSFTTDASAVQMLNSGTYFYTIGKPTTFQTWYTYQNGVWNNPDNWTLDPTGATLVNPLTAYPSDGDVAVILNGYTMTANVNNMSLFGMEIQGTLDMAATTGQSLGNVKGSGLLRINGAALPMGTYTSFVTSGTGGTVEYYNVAGTLSSAQTTYNHLLFTNTTGSAITYITASDLIVNGNFNITQISGGGTVTWQINDATNANRTMSLAGNLTVSSGGRITVGSGNMASTTQHALSIKGNFTNDGVVKFFSSANSNLSTYNLNLYTNANLYGDAVNVTFVGLTNTTLTCNNTTDFYRLIVNKGIGQQAMLTLYSSSAANFRLFASNSFDNAANAGATTYSNNSLSLINGTLQLTGAITISSLVEDLNGSSGINGGWPLPETASLWLNGSNVSVTVASAVSNTDGRRFFLYGYLRVTEGLLDHGYSRGLSTGDDGSLLMEGGTLKCHQLRPYLSAENFTYHQKGGTVEVGLIDGVDLTNLYRFDQVSDDATTTSTFIMSGGILNVYDPIQDGGNYYGIRINSASGYYQVTGGTVNVYVTENKNLTIKSTVPFYDLNVYRNSGTGEIQTTLPLTVLNDLTIFAGNTPTLNCLGNNLTVGRHLTVQANTTLTPGANTITFNGTGAQTWTQSGTLSNLNNVVVNKTAGTTLTLAGSGTFPNITGTAFGLTLTSGTLADGGKTLTVTGALNNSATHTGTGLITHNNAGASTIGGTGGTFSNLSINTDATVTMSGNQTITGALRLINTNSTLNIGSNNLTISSGTIYSSTGTGRTFNATKRILTNGLRNDGGLTLPIPSATDVTFPVGTTGTGSVAYTPATIRVRVSAAGATGMVTVRPVRSEHPNVSVTGQSAQYFWRVTSTGFSGIDSVNHKRYTYSTATLGTGGTGTGTYTPGRYNPTTFSWTRRTTPATYNAGTAGGVIPNFTPHTGWSTNGAYLDGDYTTGTVASFGAVTVFYSRQTGNWNQNTTWSSSPCTGAGACGAAVAGGVFPDGNDPVVIGNASNNHTVTVDANNRASGSLFVADGSVLDCGVRTGLDFGINTSGTGRIKIASSVANAVFPGGDFIDFIGTAGGTIEWYGNTTILPATGPAPENINLSTYYNLVVSPNAGQTITLPATNLTIYNDLTISSTTNGQVNTDESAANRTITVNRNFAVSSGVLSLRNGFVTAFSVAGNTTVASAGTISLEGGGTRTHTFTTPGNFTNDGTVTLRNGTGPEVMNLTFTGTANTFFAGTTGTASTTLNGVTINKGTSQTPVFTFNVSGTVTTQTNNWLTLQNGTFAFNKTGGSFTLVDVANNTFLIPSTTKLLVQTGTVNVISAADDDNDLLLGGNLEITGGTVNVGNAANDNDNDIEYASAGTPTITVTGGTLYVNGQVRRTLASLTGALVYNQSGGTVTVGGRSADNTRGIFEIENYAGSSFTFTGSSTLNILRPAGGAQYADLYLNPETSSVSSGSLIQIGSASLGGQTLDMAVVPTLGNLTIMGATSNAQIVNLQTNPLKVAGTLTINPASTFATNGLDVTIGGNLSIDNTGTYTGSANTTTFNGTGTQNGVLSSGSTFQNITVSKTAGTTLALSGTSPSITNLNHLSGILDVSSIGLTVNGNIVIQSSQIGSGSITLAGTNTTHTITSSGGSFTNLSFSASGAASKNVTLSGNLTINGQLSFATSNRYLSIGASRLTFSSTASMSGASSTAFIRTNGSPNDLGVVKTWPNNGGLPASFTYQVGVGNKYTPLALTLTVGNSGNLTVVPVNQTHPTYNVASSEQILNYYWAITRGSGLTYSSTGSQVYTFLSSMMSGTGGTLSAGVLDIASATPGWITDPAVHGGTAVIPTPPTLPTMTFTNFLNVNLPTVGNTFHYAVGTPNTLPNPIQPVYSRFADANGTSNPTTVGTTAIGGSWNVASNWTTSSTGYGAPLANAPTGVPVVILSGARINMNVNARVAFTTRIDGLLVVGTSFGHNLGTMRGTGTMRSITSTFPAGNYNAFVASGGGTIEYEVLSGGTLAMNGLRNEYNNLSVSTGSSGTVAMTNMDLTLNGSMTIPSGVTVTNANNRNITVARNWSNAGTFSGGTGMITFNGTTAQTINGSTTFYSLHINNSGNTVTLGTGTQTTVSTLLTLTSGFIIVPNSHTLKLATAATISGGSVNSFVQGRLLKDLTTGGTFTFPVGTTTTNPDYYRPVTVANSSLIAEWDVRYIPIDPTQDDPYLAGTQTYPNENFNTGAPLGAVSGFEYWIINRSTAASANVTLSYSTGSYRPAIGNVGNVANLRVVRWDGTRWDLPPGGGSVSQGGSNIAGTVTITNVTNFSPFTLASTDFDSPLPVVWLSFRATRVENKIALNWKTAQEVNNEKFEVERSLDGLKFFRIGTVASQGNSPMAQSYDFDDTEMSSYNRYYYRIRQVDYDGNHSYSDVVVVLAQDEAPLQYWKVYPNPVNHNETLSMEFVNPAMSSNEVQITLTSMKGVILFQNEGHLEDLKTSLDNLLRDAGAGIFLLQINDGGHRELFKVVRH